METFKNIPPQERNGYIYCIKDIQINKQYSCEDACRTYQYHRSETNFKCQWRLEPSVGTFCCTEVIIHIIATSSVADNEHPWRMDDRNYMIITTDGLSYKGIIPCDEIKGIQRHLHYGDEVYARSQADIVMHFPKIPEGTTVREIIIRGRPQLSFKIVEEDEDEFSIEHYRDKGFIPQPLENPQKGTSTYTSVSKKRGMGLIYELNYFKTLIFERFNTHLTPNEIREIEKEIELQRNTVEQYFSDSKTNSPELQELYNEYKEEAAYYRELWSEKKEAERERIIYITSVSDILNISPDEFERLCSEVMKGIGCYDVLVTTHSNDGGIDVFGKMNGKTIVAQCKRYLRNPVGTPDIQQFIGAMHNAEADKGIFFTTASFTEGAITMARKNGITMFDRTAFDNYLSIVNHIEIEKDAAQPTLWDDDLPE